MPNPKPDSKRDQGGFSLGGPIKKNKTFFFVDFEKVRSFERVQRSCDRTDRWRNGKVTSRDLRIPFTTRSCLSIP